MSYLTGEPGGYGMGSDGEGRELGGLFPRSPRVIFGHSPLTEVVAQVRFPPILKIERSPVDFQERVRSIFPLFDTVTGPSVPPSMPQLPPQILRVLGNQLGGITHRFQSEAREMTLALSTEALTLATNTYTRWEEFLAKLRSPLAALLEQYAPPFYARVGLRYINAIQREKIGVSAEVPWSQLIRRELLGVTAVPAFERNLLEVTKKIRVKMIEPEGALLFQHGLFTLPGGASPAYMIDFDLYHEGRTEVEHAERLLDEYHAVAGNAFRWCIQPGLSDALGPHPV